VSVFGNVVVNNTIATPCSVYLTYGNVTASTAVGIACTNTGGNTNLVLQNTVVTQTGAFECISLNSVRGNFVLAQLQQATAASCLTIAGNGSVSCVGVTFTAAGGAGAAPIVAINNTVGPGIANSFQQSYFTYTAATVASAKAAVNFNNTAALTNNNQFTNNVIDVGGSTTVFSKTGAGTVGVYWGTTTCVTVSALPAAAGLTYTYLQTPVTRLNSLRDSANSAGTANQVLSAGAAGAGLNWTTLGVSSLGALGATPGATSYQSQTVVYNTATNVLSYGQFLYSCVVVATSGQTISLSSGFRGRKYILTGTAAITFSGATLTANDVGFFVELKNGNGTLGGDITISGATGNTVIHNQSATQNGQIVFLYWTGTAFVAY
jgi:hypothetical protein